MSCVPPFVDIPLPPQILSRSYYVYSPFVASLYSCSFSEAEKSKSRSDVRKRPPPLDFKIHASFPRTPPSLNCVSNHPVNFFQCQFPYCSSSIIILPCTLFAWRNPPAPLVIFIPFRCPWCVFRQDPVSYQPPWFSNISTEIRLWALSLTIVSFSPVFLSFPFHVGREMESPLRAFQSRTLLKSIDRPYLRVLPLFIPSIEPGPCFDTFLLHSPICSPSQP